MNMIRVGVDEKLSSELLAGFSGVEVIRVPRGLREPLEVDLWVLPFGRKDVAETFQYLRGVKVVQSLMAGVDWVLPWLPSGVVLCDGRGLHDVSASEWVVGAILATMKRFPLYRDLQAVQEWRGFGDAEEEGGVHAGQYRLLAEELAGKTVLIVGYGSIGAAIEARLLPFGVKVLRVARSARMAPVVSPVGDLRRLLPEADVVVVIVPLTPETRGLLGAVELGLMKPGALLVNAARGPVVETDALVVALEERRIRAALDVTDPEPLPEGHPLWTAPGCFITPHIGGSTPEFIFRAFEFAGQQVRRYVDGEPLENMVTEAGY